ncbi:hypothetical protein [Winogradskya humida]|uniref:Uncharacterized protein n=1 Tax=Winogradskya humida TaxID=113566 RepID=A0ABQ3ZID6_9ACTN|nr:hypothetical protein [Actinoplanes humidus]GIE18309.1 hypothetical protein Ahu01nite_014110 [Actinoplanes humidus]
MEILPGIGVALAKIGDSRTVVESRTGPPIHPGRSPRAVYETDPLLVLTYHADDTVELVELSHGGDQVFFDGIQLTDRFLADVVADLTARGHAGEPTDIGHRFEPGFAIFSTGSMWAGDLDPDATDDDPRAVSEGVSVAPYDYFRSRK